MMRILVVLALLIASSTAHAQSQQPRLSDRGRVLIAGELGGWWQNHDNWHVQLGPSAAYFLRDRVGLGGYFTYANAREGFYSSRVSRYHFGVQSTNELPLAEKLGLWVNARVGYVRVDGDRRPVVYPITGNPNTGNPAPGTGVVAAFSPFVGPRNWVHFGLFVPVVYQLNGHVGAGIGPDLAIDWAPGIEAVNVQVGLKTWIPISI